MAVKLSQEELRRLMRETQAKKVTRIESPLAKYDSKGHLWCVICNVIVVGEVNWSGHLSDGGHKKKIEELKQKQKKLNAPSTEGGQKKSSRKRSTPKDLEEPVARKLSKFDTIAEFSKKEMLIKQVPVPTEQVTSALVDAGNDEEDEENSEEVHETMKMTLPPVVDVPSDFFDDGVQPMEISEPSTSTTSKVSTTAKPNDSDLPKGFFDDPKQDARARNTKITSMEEEMNNFFKEIAQETLISEEVIEVDIEKTEKEKLIDEIDEQINNWSKVEQFQKRLEELHRKKEEQKASSAMSEPSSSTPNAPPEEEDEDGDEDSDLDDDHFWRAKKI